MFTQDCNFIFVPVDKDFNSLITDLSISDTPFPSQMDLNGIAGFLIVPAFLDTKEILFSQWMDVNNPDTPNISGNFLITANPNNDGKIMMNWDPTKKSANPLSIGSVQYKKTATVPGMQQNYAIFLKTGSALLLEKLLLGNEWAPQTIKEIIDSDAYRKSSNSYPRNKTIAKQYWDGIDYTIKDLKEIFAACSTTLGYKIKADVKLNMDHNVYEVLLETYKEDPEYFTTLRFDLPIIESCIEKAKNDLEIEFTNALLKLSGLNSENSE